MSAVNAIRPLAAGLLAVSLVAVGPAASAAAPAAGQDRAPAAETDTLTLREAVGVGLGEDPDIRAERAGRESASGERLAAWGSLLPSLSADASFGRLEFTNFTYAAPEGSSRRLEQPESGVRKSSSQGVSLGWTLLDGGRRIAALDRSAASLDAAEHRISAAERTTVAEVRVAYFSALEQRALADMARRQLEARRRDLELTRERYAIAAADRSEILGARSDTLDARMRLLGSRRLARVRMRELRAAMGASSDRVPPDRPLAPVGSLPVPDTLDGERLVRRAVRSHPDLRALDAGARAASADRWAARSDYLPTVNLGYSLSRNEQLGPEGGFFVVDPSNDSEGLSVRLSWSLFGGFDRERREREASATLRRTRAKRAKRRIELETTVRDGVEELRRRRERLDLLRRKLELTRERLEVTRERFRLGDVSYLELQQVIESLSGAERERISERYAYLRAWAELERASGSLSGEECGNDR